MTTGGEPFTASIEKEANTSSDPNITSVAEPNTHSTEEPLNVTSELNPNDYVLQFIVQNFDRVKAMYTAFTHARKEVLHRSLPTGRNPSGEPWNSDSEEAHPSKALGKTFVENDEVEPIPSNPLDANTTKGKGTQNMEFCHQHFVFKEPNRYTKDLVASPFTSRIREYDMPDGLKVPTNLKAYNGMSDPNDHLAVFMGTIDIHKLSKPVWCRFFPITLCGAARFWYENLAPGSIDGFHQLRDKFRANFLQQHRFQKTQVKILGIQQRPNESLKDYVTRFNKETLHMADQSDVIASRAFISCLRPGRLFKDLISRPPTSLEDLFTQTHNFIRAEDANNENRLREPRHGNRETKQHATYKDLSRRPKDRFVSHTATQYNKHHTTPLPLL
ncbi:gag protein [Tanacetum coccineum]